MTLKKGLATALITGAVALSGFGFEGSVLTQVIYQATAYTLPTGVWELEGMFSLPAFGFPWASVSYGLTENIQVSTGLTADLFGMPNLGVKLALGRIGPVALAASAGVTYLLADSSLYLGSGLLASLQADGLGIHAGASLQALPEFSISPYAAADYDLMPNTKLLTELNFLPLRARIGLLLRALNSLDLRGWVSFFPFSLGANLSLRF